MTARTPFYVTTAISYPNGPPHIGHAYEAIATDAIARFMRLDGYDVYFLTGTDEHGQKIQQTAAKEGLTPRQLLDRNVPRFEAMVKRMNCSNDDFIHTTEERHHRSSEAIWKRMEQNGDIYLGKYAGWYSVRDEAYYAENETQLNEDKVRVTSKTGTPVEWVEEASHFFKLSAYQDRLLKLYERPNFVVPKERLNEVASFVRGGLQDLSISRTTFDWASACLAARATSCMCGLMPSPITSRASGFQTPRAKNLSATGQPPFMSSARTSCASTQSIGRPS
jgi:methionyl-tRNA synthetase